MLKELMVLQQGMAQYLQSIENFRDHFANINKSNNSVLPLLIALIKTFTRIPIGKHIIEPYEFSTIKERYQALTF